MASAANISAYVEGYIESMAVLEPRYAAFLAIGLLGLLGLMQRRRQKS
jgi:MYXO-CTERM domain-containing protein